MFAEGTGFPKTHKFDTGAKNFIDGSKSGRERYTWISYFTGRESDRCLVEQQIKSLPKLTNHFKKSLEAYGKHCVHLRMSRKKDRKSKYKITHKFRKALCSFSLLDLLFFENFNRWKILKTLHLHNVLNF